MSKQKKPIMKIQNEILSALAILATITTVITAGFSVFLNLRSENLRLSENIQNIAKTISQNAIVTDELSKEGGELLKPYMDSLKDSLSNIDVISIINKNSKRIYHTNSELIGTIYDGTVPSFSKENEKPFVTDDTGPSGPQKRACAAIYGKEGEYLGFVIAVTLNQNINRIIINTILIHLSCAALVLLCAFFISGYFSKKVKALLLGYEPDTFSAMFSVRDNILESLEEGVLACDENEEIIFINKAAQKILGKSKEENRKLSQVLPELSVDGALKNGERIFNAAIHHNKSEMLADIAPVFENEKIIGALCILKDRTEYTKMMEDLTGVRFLVESMRANNHDFTNKLHVILGLIQMGETKKASEYITNVTAIQQNVIHGIMKNIDDPSVAALLIGKYARASELNIKFQIAPGSSFSRSNTNISANDLVTIIGNLIENAMDSINEKNDLPKELTFGIYHYPKGIIINVDDTGKGIPKENREKIFQNGFSSKGENRGTGLYLIKSLVNKYDGEISLESEVGTGTSFSVTLKEEKENV